MWSTFHCLSDKISKYFDQRGLQNLRRTFSFCGNHLLMQKQKKTERNESQDGWKGVNCERGQRKHATGNISLFLSFSHNQ